MIIVISVAYAIVALTAVAAWSRKVSALVAQQIYPSNVENGLALIGGCMLALMWPVTLLIVVAALIGRASLRWRR